MPSTASPAIQEPDLDAVSPSVHCLITKQTAGLEYADVTVESGPEGTVVEVHTTRVQCRS